MHAWVNPETQEHHDHETLPHYLGHSPILMIVLSFIAIAAIILGSTLANL